MRRWSSLLVLLLPSLVSANDSFDNWAKKEMEANHIVGVSIAVFGNYQIKYVKTYGFRDKRKRLPVNENTVFSAGSISKPITALAALKTFVEKNLSLGANINDILTSWHLPENRFSKQKPVTMPLLLEHSAGVVGFRFHGYSTNKPVPTLIDVLNGRKPANTPAITVVRAPGKKYEYAPAGYVIVQQALVDIYVQPFAQIMRKVILKPFGMTHSTFVQPLPETFKKNYAKPYLPNGKPVPYGPLIFVAEAAEGLYTTPTDLAKFLIKFQEILSGKSTLGIINARMLKQMLIPRANAHMGMGMHVNLNCYGEEVSEGGKYFGHIGFNSGYLSYMLASLDGGNGLVIMINTAPKMEGKKVPQYKFIIKVIKRIATDENWL